MSFEQVTGTAQLFVQIFSLWRGKKNFTRSLILTLHSNMLSKYDIMIADFLVAQTSVNFFKLFCSWLLSKTGY